MKTRSEKKLADSLSGFSEDFMTERNQPPVQERASLHREKKNDSQLPEAWEWKRLGEIAEINPRIDKSRISDNKVVSFVPMQAVGAGNGQIDVSMVKTVKEVKKGYTPFQEGDVLFAKITPCMENGKMAVVPKLTGGFGFGSTEFHVLRPDGAVDPQYLYYFVSCKDFRREAAHKMTGAVGQKRVPTAYLADCSIPLAPFDQQELIVSEIEKQFSRLDEAVAGLKRIKANLKRYKAAVLKAAVEGNLVETEAELARLEGRNFETGAQLLQRILEIRRSKWKGKGNYKEPVAPNSTKLPELPKGWAWVTVEQLTWLVTSGSRGWGEFYSETGVLFIRAQDIKTDELHLASVARVDIPDDAEGMRSSVGVNDLLITITGANVTKSALVSSLSKRAFVSQHVALLKLNDPATSLYVYNWIVSPSNGRKYLEALAYGAGKPGLSLEQLRGLAVAFPPFAEQHRIVAEVDRRLSLVREVETQVDANLKRAERLRQGILKKAFAGNLHSN